MKAIIIDDEHLARELIKSYLQDHPLIQVVATCQDGFQGIKAIQEFNPDLIFLDIQMPKINGFEMLELLDKMPVTIFTTAYNEHAIKAFEVNAVDYLLKPFSKERLDQAIQKAIERNKYRENEQKAIKELASELKLSEKLERVVVKNGTNIHVIPVSSLLYLEAHDDYVMLYTSQGKFLKQQTMKYFETQLSPLQFVRIHRSYMVNINEIVQLEPYEKESWRLALKNNTRLPVSKTGHNQLKKILDL